MRKILTILFIIFTMSTFAQDEKKEIMHVINNVFEAMRKSDSIMLKQSFTEDPKTYTAYVNKQGESVLAVGDFQRFVKAVGQQKDQLWDEPIWNEKVEVDGNLASVWVDYVFYLDDQFSHCGVDAFHLIKQESGWKIFHLVDTRRKKDCDVPDYIKKDE